MPRYDWEVIRSEYVLGPDEVTLDSLSKKYGPHQRTLRARSTLESWVQQRALQRHRTSTKTRERASTKEAEIRVRHCTQSKEFQKAAVKALGELDTKDLTPIEIIRFYKDACEIERKAAGIPDEHEVKAIIKGELENEVEKFIEDLRGKLSQETMSQVIEALQE